MKKIFLVAVVTLLTFSCKNKVEAEIKTIEVATTSTTQKLDPNATYAKAEFNVDGMTCMIGCAKTIEKKLAKMDGVKSAKVDFDKKLAMVEYNDAIVTPENLTETVTLVSDTYKVSNMKTVEHFSTE
ncbi:heavy-metal-associated domain-containing protein [Aestuariibaculum suncheonense]|uniref:Heavy-metal-associated domain-containing protein n=1 Tax=Aestuariibaculum suncheonense TaxID=1028745 RepID=A0A8J6UA66_9FLAO|nr:heavy metal-associated domain-containing protein [Aestuariibaculum suncheonense]MBD0834047.1 heavy-metal-associated domain-containing protein [Aestuariibaculum suncheonense]